MQRDLYSAFLSKCVDVKSNSLDIARAKLLWPGLEPVLSEAVSSVYQSANSGKVPASFGVGRRQSGSPVKSEATITEAVDDVIRINEDESREPQRGYMNSGISRLQPWRGLNSCPSKARWRRVHRSPLLYHLFGSGDQDRIFAVFSKISLIVSVFPAHPRMLSRSFLLYKSSFDG